MSRDVNSASYTYMFAFIICIISSVALAGIYAASKDRQKENVLTDTKKNVLLAANLVESDVTPAKVKSFFEAPEGETPPVKAYVINTADGEVDSSIDMAAFLKNKKKFQDEGKELIFECVLEDQESFILPVEGAGLWDDLKGYLALAPDCNTIIGLSFYFNMETPGLGKEIEENWFRDNFKEKKIFDENKKFVGVSVVKGQAPKGHLHKVDGITAATITSDGVTDMMTSTSDKGSLGKKYLAFFKKKRS